MTLRNEASTSSKATKRLGGRGSLIALVSRKGARGNGGAQVHPELDGCVAMQAVKMSKLLAYTGVQPPPLVVSSYNEGKARKLAAVQSSEWRLHNERYLSRAYPAATRQDSSNISGQLLCELWGSGVQMVALNYQTPSKALALNEALFELNARCGYVLRPEFRKRLRPHLKDAAAQGGADAAARNDGGCYLRIKVLMATELPKLSMQAPCEPEVWDAYHPICSHFAGSGDDKELHTAEVVSPTVGVEFFGGLVGTREEGKELAGAYFDAGTSTAVSRNGLSLNGATSSAQRAGSPKRLSSC